MNLWQSEIAGSPASPVSPKWQNRCMQVEHDFAYRFHNEAQRNYREEIHQQADLDLEFTKRKIILQCEDAVTETTNHLFRSHSARRKHHGVAGRPHWQHKSVGTAYSDRNHQIQWVHLCCFSLFQDKRNCLRPSMSSCTNFSPSGQQWAAKWMP